MAAALLKVRERRCDASCWRAKQPACDCVCGGRNHALGSLEKARARVAADVQAGRYGERLRGMRWLPKTIRLRVDEVGGVNS